MVSGKMRPLPGGLTTALLVLASLLVTVVCAVAEPVLQVFRMQRFGNMLAASVLYALPVWMWTAAIMLAYANLSGHPARPRTMRRVFSVAGNGFRFLPLIVVCSAGLPFFLAAMLALIVNATDVLVSFTVGDIRWKPRRDWLLSMAVAFTLQTACVMYFMHEKFLASLATAAGSAAMLSLVLLVGLASTDTGTNYRKAVSSAGVALALAFYLTLTGFGAGYEGGTDPRGNAPPPAPVEAAERELPQEGTPAMLGGDLYGVILWPEVKKQTKVVAPLPVWFGASQGTLAAPLTIPFSGEYWMYRLPYRKPPRNSYRRRGSPAKLFFHTTTGDPLMMEAKQKLDMPVALACCVRIRMAIHNADPHPASVLLELVLADSASRQEMSLGRSMVGIAAEQEIEFAIPSAPALRQFDEIQVVFDRDRVNHSRSARIAIDRFVLVPKGV